MKWRAKRTTSACLWAVRVAALTFRWAPSAPPARAATQASTTRKISAKRMRSVIGGGSLRQRRRPKRPQGVALSLARGHCQPRETATGTPQVRELVSPFRGRPSRPALPVQAGPTTRGERVCAAIGEVRRYVPIRTKYLEFVKCGRRRSAGLESGLLAVDRG
jgi:hypothetical protein